ncbi:Uncharacterised protein [Mycobacteroides abscessus subsp. abscessus]|nr:Uncharacterised protein [Mycobacteroides abscessus subsp. abscessus]
MPRKPKQVKTPIRAESSKQPAAAAVRSEDLCIRFRFGRLDHDKWALASIQRDHRRSFEETPGFSRGEESELSVFLVLDIAFHYLQGCAADSGDEVRVGPQGG